MNEQLIAAARSLESKAEASKAKDALNNSDS